MLRVDQDCEEEERHDYYDLYSGCDFLNVRNLFTRVHGEDEVDDPIRDHGDDRQHFKCKVRDQINVIACQFFMIYNLHITVNQIYQSTLT